MAGKTRQRLVAKAPCGQPLDPQTLRDWGVSPEQTTRPVNAGSLQRLFKGAYLLAGDTPTRAGNTSSQRSEIAVNLSGIASSVFGSSMTPS
ncbi:AbiEi antitoxin N-terminal domain-containing protein [Paraburkholderia aromaticivorans]|uniref:AbiEi antitoxin N-terminal domain-containing protein n=1 Tax=Paraburkholderia aromaticivorans TaxID=2026199 RepID=UPI0038BB55F3